VETQEAEDKDNGNFRFHDTAIIDKIHRIKLGNFVRIVIRYFDRSANPLIYQPTISRPG